MAKDKQTRNITPEEAMARRQSAPQPTAEEYVREHLAASPAAAQAVNGMTYASVTPVIGREQLHDATLILQKYKTGKARLEQKIVANEQWYKLRHWEQMRKSETREVEPVSAWLFNCLCNKHADAMDNFPEPVIKPHEPGDRQEAEMLSSIIPVILAQGDFEQVYSDVAWYKLKSGCGVYGVFWDKDKLHGMGDVSVKKIDLLNLFWEPGIQDIQQSANLFHVELVDNETLIGMYPQLHGQISTPTVDLARYVYDDTVDTTEKSAVIDWYYHKTVNGKTVLHYCKYVNDTVLYATENDPELSQRGLYDHGLYPFVFDVLFGMEGTPAGFGYIDVGKDTQAYIDLGNQAILNSTLVTSKPRFFIRRDGTVDEQEFADLNNTFIHVDGNLGEDSIRQIDVSGIGGIDVTVINNKIDELKETTGNRDVSTGGTSGGVTAASGIAAMQEAGSKLSRDANKSAYRAFRGVCNIIIELIRQFYTLPRAFRIVGKNGTDQFVQYSNAGIQPQPQGVEFGVDMGVRVPQFDIDVSATKQSPYSKAAQNDLALQFFAAGFFNPAISDQALACLDMMDFDHKDAVVQRIAQNGTMYQQILALQEQMMMLGAMVDDAKGGTEVTDALAAQFGMEAPMQPSGGRAGKTETSSEGQESGVTQRARQRVADSTAPA